MSLRNSLTFMVLAVLIALAIFPPAVSVQAISTPTTPPSASLACSGKDVVVSYSHWTTGRINVSYTPDSGGAVTPAIVNGSVGASGSLTITMPSYGSWKFNVDDTHAPVLINQPITCTAPSPAVDPVPGPAFGDSRLNRWEPFSPVAIYAVSNGAAFYAIDQEGHGVLAFTLDTSALPAFAGGTQLVDSFTAQGLNFEVYWLDTGELQVNVGPFEGKLYTYVFDASGQILKDFHSF